MNQHDPDAVVAGMTRGSTPRFENAIVLGGSMAGLVTAQALSRHFRRVTIVERDRLPDRPDARSGVPQADHLHVLLPGGAEALEKLLPGFAEGLLAYGAVPVDAPTDLLWLNSAGWVTRFPANHQILSASRDFIEWYTRRRVVAMQSIEVLDGCNVLDLAMSSDSRRVVGVTIAHNHKSTSGAGTETLHADLVVDATGRRSRLPQWLERAGYDRPEETRIDAHLSYATRIYRRPAGVDWKAIFLQAQPPLSSRMGILFPLEGDRWMVTVQGIGDDRPPIDDEGFEQFLSMMRSPAIYDAVRGAEALTSAVGFANTANRRRHFDKMRRWPERLLAVGDSACAFNPVYGQGMSVAAKTALVLERSLAGFRGVDLDGFVGPMQRLVSKTGDAAWMIATGDDLRFPTTSGATPSRVTRMQHRYLDRVMAAATTDRKVLSALMKVFFLLAPPTILFRPGIVGRALRSRRPTGTAEPISADSLSVSPTS